MCSGNYLHFSSHMSQILMRAFLTENCPLSVVVVIIVLVVVNILYFYLLLQKHCVNFTKTLHKASLGGELYMLKRGTSSFLKRRWLGRSEERFGCLKNLPQNYWADSIQIITKHLEKRALNCVQIPFQR